MKRIVGVIVGVVAVIVIACSSGGGGGDKFTRDCRARGGHVQTTGEHSKRCLPPEGGWQ